VGVAYDEPLGRDGGRILHWSTEGDGVLGGYNILNVWSCFFLPDALPFASIWFGKRGRSGDDRLMGHRQTSDSYLFGKRRNEASLCISLARCSV
jgi:hypothetical protein